MKAKFLLFSLLMFFVASNSVYATKEKRKIKRRIQLIEKMVTRQPLVFDFSVAECDNSLQIVFTGCLYDADIIVTDNKGNVVLQEFSSEIYSGKIYLVPMPNAYPYSVEINSPAMDVYGEIIEEKIF